MSEQRQVLNKTNMGIGEGLPLEASSGGIEELRKDIQRLMDMEENQGRMGAYRRDGSRVPSTSTVSTKQQRA